MFRSQALGALIAFGVGIIAGSIGCQTASGLSEILLVDNGAQPGQWYRIPKATGVFHEQCGSCNRVDAVQIIDDAQFYYVRYTKIRRGLPLEPPEDRGLDGIDASRRNPLSPSMVTSH